MARFGLALKTFWRTWRDAEFAAKVEQIARPERAEPIQLPAPAPPTPSPARNDAVNLLAVLQREARFVDFVQEQVSNYSDEQIGAAARDVHRGCAAALERMFSLRALASSAEGDQVEVPPNFDSSRYRLTGRVQGAPPYHGVLCHAGWQATRCELPVWTGSRQARDIVAPMEVEVK